MHGSSVFAARGVDVCEEYGVALAVEDFVPCILALAALIILAQAVRARLPRAFDRLPNGHEGSHHFLADDFVTAVTTGALPPVNAWVAARYTMPGIVAHESALKGGVRLDIRDFGDAPPA